MQGIICYYSGSGNTKLACRYLASCIDAVSFEFADITKGKPADFGVYDIVGFATFTDAFGLPHLFQSFLEDLPIQGGKPAFVFNTYGSFSGRTLSTLAALATAKNFTVVAGHSLHTPESFPPMNILGVGSHAPSKQGLKAFNRFIEHLADLLRELQKGQPISHDRVHIGFLNSLLPSFPRTTSRFLMGDKSVDETRCTECGVCARVCPYAAIALDPKPVFDEARCYGCWACYNHCPEQAIHTTKLKSGGYYPHPNAQLREKLRS